jgi:hypothetical protein
MYRLAAVLLVIAGEAIAHPGHGAPVVHWHAWDYLLPSLLLAAAAAVGFAAIRRVRRQDKTKDQ